MKRLRWAAVSASWTLDVREPPGSLWRADLCSDSERASGEAFPDPDFSIVDRSSFAVMQRLGVFRAARLDEHFAIFRFGKARSRGFEIVR